MTTTVRGAAGRLSRRSSGRSLALAAALLVVAGALVWFGAGQLLRSPTPTTALDAPRFVEETARAGIDRTYDGGATFSTGGGVAVFDCDGDAKPDVYVAGGANPAALYRNESPVGGALRFAPLHAGSTDLTDVIGAYPLDVDGDGLIDLAVLRLGENVLLRGLGDCRFERANEAWGFDGGQAWTTAFSATWEGSDALPTLAIGNYLGLEPSGKPASACAPNELIRPRADGRVFAAPTPLQPGYCTLSVLFSDWDRSGRRDLRVSNDRHYYVDGGEQLWPIAGTGAPRAYSEADGWVRMQIWGMGIASHDLTGDGYPEVYLTSQGDNKLQTLAAGPAQPRYRDIALKRGVTAAQPFVGGDVLPSTAWHPEFEDVNNDGFVDLFVSKGNVSAMPDYAQRDPSNLFLGQADGTFREGAEAAGILNFERARGAAVADLNLDGLPDLIEVNLGAPVKVWRNVGAGDAEHPAAMGNWVALTIEQPGRNLDAIGAWVELRAGDATIRRELTIGGGHAGGQLGWVHFGLGPAPEAQVRVTWPDGTVGPWMRVGANGFAIIDRGAAAVRPWQPTGH